MTDHRRVPLQLDGDKVTGTGAPQPPARAREVAELVAIIDARLARGWSTPHAMITLLDDTEWDRLLQFVRDHLEPSK